MKSHTPDYVGPIIGIIIGAVILDFTSMYFLGAALVTLGALFTIGAAIKNSCE